MPLDMNDPYLRAERQPPALVALGVRLKKAYGVGSDNFGIKGNEFHYTGFHRSRNFLENSDLGDGSDYSTRGVLNQGGDKNNNSAFDFTPGVWGTKDNTAKMIVLTKRLRSAAQRNDPRLADYYEFAGTEDGVHVITFYAQGGATKTPFDSSHLQHIHGSKYRSRSDNDDTGLGDVMLGINDEEDDMGASFGPIMINKYDAYQPQSVTSLCIPPVQAGGADPRAAWINVTNDTFGHKYALRVWYSTGDKNWAPLGPNNGQWVLDSGQRFWFNLPPKTSVVSIQRLAIDATGNPTAPTLELQPYDGNLTCCIERGPIVPAVA